MYKNPRAFATHTIRGVKLSDSETRWVPLTSHETMLVSWKKASSSSTKCLRHIRVKIPEVRLSPRFPKVNELFMEQVVDIELPIIMGLHTRLGANSKIRDLDPLLVRVIIQMSIPDVTNWLSHSQKIVMYEGNLFGKPEVSLLNCAPNAPPYKLTNYDMSRFPWGQVIVSENFKGPRGNFISRTIPGTELCVGLPLVDKVYFKLLKHDTLIIEFAKVRHRQHDQEKISPFHNLPPKLFRKIIGMVLGV